jgi:hypothetical protein
MKKLLFLPLIIAFGMVVLVGGTYASSTGWEELDDTEEELGTGIEGTLKSSPTASPVAGTYTSSQSVTLSVDGAESIRYTTNGSTPTCSSTEYTSAISVSSTTTIKAISCYPGDESSDVASFTYTIDVDTGSPGGGSSGGSRDDDDEDEEEEAEETEEEELEESEETDEEDEEEQGNQERRGELEQQAEEVEGELNNVRTRQRSLNQIRETINMLIGVAGEQEKDDIANALEQLLSRLDALEGRLDEEEAEKEGELNEIERRLGLISEIDRLDRMEETANALLSATENESVISALQQFIERIEEIRERIESEL